MLVESAPSTQITQGSKQGFQQVESVASNSKQITGRPNTLNNIKKKIMREYSITSPSKEENKSFDRLVNNVAFLVQEFKKNVNDNVYKSVNNHIHSDSQWIRRHNHQLIIHTIDYSGTLQVIDECDFISKQTLAEESKETQTKSKKSKPKEKSKEFVKIVIKLLNTVINILKKETSANSVPERIAAEFLVARLTKMKNYDFAYLESK